MNIDESWWQLINALIQWLVIPLLILIWNHERRINANEKEILRTLTILEEREKRAIEIHKSQLEAILRLQTAVERLTARLLDEKLNGDK